MADQQTGPSISEAVADWSAGLSYSDLPESVVDITTKVVLDGAGLMVAARDEDYVQAVVASADGEGNCTALGHAQGFSAADAAFINGTAAHGEDYDDTAEGSPMHAGGAVGLPTLFATAERYGLSGEQLILGIAACVEISCRLAVVAPTSQHRACFHPTAVLGCFGATLGASAALGLNAKQTMDALGTAGSLAAGIIEYLGDGSWTKRMHPGWNAQAGLRAALMGKAGFFGPKYVFEGEHGAYTAFAHPDIPQDFGQVTDTLGKEWVADKITFKSYACGTMTQPFIDCALRFREVGVNPEEIESIECNVGEGTVHRLWEPLELKQNIPTPYAGKFSVPYCIGIAMVDGSAGLIQFTGERFEDPVARSIAQKVTYVIDPENEYPANYTGHLKATMKDGTVHEFEQPHMRGGPAEPLSEEELVGKFRANCEYGGWDAGRIDELQSYCLGIAGAENLDGLKAFRG
ncbi:MAG TPA: 2-methylcitrate dehydratase [Rhodospirillaceae bacterium]|nr:2-methylcitrate dehydratase [Rhodospirillaceae bacterium]HAA92793.1 2-methylcitrate dehydratase [Rhodospirillaceae bacterium]HAT34484.1 2-methylcitrate dehydratase [Rhodospirillaceae bacterium]